MRIRRPVPAVLAVVATLGMLALPAGAQFPTIIANLFTAAATSPQTTPPISNVGQAGHNVYLSFSNAPSHTCSNPAATGELEYSFDNSTWTGFGTPLTSTSVAMLNQTYLGLGVFSYIRFNLTSFDTTNCRATAYYTGIQQAINVLAAAGVPSTQLFCQQTTNGSTSSAGVSTVLAAPASGAIHVCSISLTDTSGTTAQVFQFGSGSAGTCSSLGTALTQSFILQPNTSFSLGSGAGQLFTAGPGNPLCMNLGGTAPNSGSWFVTYQIL